MVIETSYQSSTSASMYISKPITWLFIIATIMVDLVLVSLGPERFKAYQEVVTGFVLGQIALLAIWAIRGRVHRLLRASCFILVSGLVAIILPFMDTELAIVFVYALLIFLFGFFVEVFRYMSIRENEDSSQERKWRYPIIEFFGWSIVVAIASLLTHQMKFDPFIEESRGWVITLCLIAVPSCLVLFIRKDLRDVRTIGALVIVSVAIAASLFEDFYTLIASQACYLISWMTVLTLDNIRYEATQIESKLEFESPKLHIPHTVGQAVPDEAE